MKFVSASLGHSKVKVNHKNMYCTFSFLKLSGIYDRMLYEDQGHKLLRDIRSVSVGNQAVMYCGLQ